MTVTLTYSATFAVYNYIHTAHMIVFIQLVRQYTTYHSHIKESNSITFHKIILAQLKTQNSHRSPNIL